MRRISTRLVLSHLMVAVIATLTTFLVVRWLAPGLYDATLMRAQQGGRGGGGGPAAGMGLRQEFAAAIDRALLAGAAAGVAAATILGVFVALRLSRTLGRLREATRRIAAGDYGARVDPPAETELAEVAGDVNTLGAALAQTEERRVQLVGEVAHEMRTPLTVIDGYVEAMMDGVLPLDEATLGLLVTESRRLRRLANDLSSLSRVEEGGVALVRTRIDLRDVTRDAAERLRPQTEDAGLNLEVELAPEPVLVDADVDRLGQLVTNLIGNAIRATPPGGRIGVSCRVSGGTARLVVNDTGEGLTPGSLERVFERFYRVPGRRSSAADAGSGIGLTIARSIARLHGGDLLADSAGQGQGATFTLTLPVVPRG